MKTQNFLDLKVGHLTDNFQYCRFHFLGFSVPRIDQVIKRTILKSGIFGKILVKLSSAKIVSYEVPGKWI